MKRFTPFGVAFLLILGTAGSLAAQVPATTEGKSTKRPEVSDVAPQPLNLNELKTRIGYPREAVASNVEGKVVVRVRVDERGNSVAYEVLHSPHDLLANAVKGHILELKFSPGIMDGKPVLVWVTIPFDFRLNQDDVPKPSTLGKGNTLYTLSEVDSVIVKNEVPTIDQIDLAYQHLTAFPTQVLKFEQLQYLDLSHNPISVIPESIGTLKNLRMLKVDHMQLASLPNSIWTIPGLKVVTVDGNQFPKSVQRTLEKSHPSALYPRNAKGAVIW
jgi:TonB family protein